MLALRQALTTAQRRSAEMTVRRTRVDSTRGELLAVYREETSGAALAEVAALVHRLAPGCS